MKWIEGIKLTGNLPSHGGFYKCASHFDESCFRKDLKMKILVLLCLFIRHEIFLFLTKISYTV